MIILRQKEFGFIGKLAAKRVNTLQNRAQNIVNNLQAPRTKSLEERQLTGKLLKYAKKNNITAMNLNPGNEGAIRPDFLTTEQLNSLNQAVNSGKLNKKELNFYNTLLQGGKVINVHGKNSSAATIAHELGHSTGNVVSGNQFYEPKLPKVYNDYYHDGIPVKKINGGLFNVDRSSLRKPLKPSPIPTPIPQKKSTKINKTIKPGKTTKLQIPKRKLPESDSRFKALKMSIDNWKGYGPRLREEARATKTGLGMLKDFGASKEFQKASKQELNNALQTYKIQRKLSVLKPIARYADSSIIGDVSGKINKQLSQNTSNAINTVYGRGGRF